MVKAGHCMDLSLKSDFSRRCSSDWGRRIFAATVFRVILSWTRQTSPMPPIPIRSSSTYLRAKIMSSGDIHSLIVCNQRTDLKSSQILIDLAMTSSPESPSKEEEHTTSFPKSDKSFSTATMKRVPTFKIKLPTPSNHLKTIVKKPHNKIITSVFKHTRYTSVDSSVATNWRRISTVLTHPHSLNSQAHWLAQGYLQGQRDFLVKLVEQKFNAEVPHKLMTAIDQVPAAMLESVGSLVLSAPDANSALKSVEVYVA